MGANATVEERGAEEWFVSDGENIVGPVSAAVLARAIDEGKVSLDIWAGREGEEAWTKVGDLPELRAGESSGVRRKEISDEDRRRARVAHDLGAIVGARSRGEAALHVLASSVAVLACEGGLVHLALADGKRFVTTCAHGPRALDVHPRALKSKDPVIAAFVAGARVLRAGSFPVPARAMTASRLHALGVATLDVLAFPLRVRGDLVGALELGAPIDRDAFDSLDIELVEQLAAALSLAPA